LLEAESDAEIDIEEHCQRLHHVSKVKQATVCCRRIILLYNIQWLAFWYSVTNFYL